MTYLDELPSKAARLARPASPPVPLVSQPLADAVAAEVARLAGLRRDLEEQIRQVDAALVSLGARRPPRDGRTAHLTRPHGTTALLLEMAAAWQPSDGPITGRRALRYLRAHGWACRPASPQQAVAGCLSQLAAGTSAPLRRGGRGEYYPAAALPR